MNIQNVISSYNKKGVRLTLADDSISIENPHKVPISNLQDFIKRHEKALKDWLNARQPKPSKIPLVPVPRGGALPASTGQQRMWYLQQQNPRSYTYNEQLEVQIHGALDLDLLNQCLNEVVKRHESLRTVFKENVDGELLQIIEDPETIEISLISLEKRNVRSPKLEEEVKQICLELGQKAYNLSVGPLFRVNILQLPENKQIFLFAFHHSIFDGRSLVVLLREMNVLYNAYSRGVDPDLPPISLHCADYACWEQKWLDSDEIKPRLAYWKGYLSDLPLSLNLPYDRPRTATIEGVGTRLDISIPQTLTNQLNELAAQENVSIFVVLYCALSVLLMRYTGQTDIPIGTLAANRPDAQMQNMMGFLVNTLILRTDLSGKSSFRELLKELSPSVTETIYQHAIPYNRLVSIARADGRPEDAPLCQVVLRFKSIPYLERRWCGKKIIRLRSQSMQATKFDISISLEIGNNGIEGHVEYNTNLFEIETIKRLWKHFVLLLESIAEKPGQEIHSISFLSKSEVQKILYSWNNTKVDYPHDLCIHQLFETQVEKTPDACAVVFEDKILTYRELNNKSNQISHYLITQDIELEERIGLCVERSPEMIIGILGILKAGATYVPIDPDYPEQRLTFMLEDAGTKWLLTQAALKESLSKLALKQTIISIDTDMEGISIQKPKNTNLAITPGNLAYIIYTSGSTGRPKGVAIPHTNVVALCHWHQNALEVHCGVKGTQVANISFDATVWEIWPYITSGACLFILLKDVVLSSDQLVRYLNVNRITHCFLPTPLVERTLSEPCLPNVALKYLLTGGDKLNPILRSNFPFKIINNYGPTEVTVATTSGEVNLGSPIAPSIGFPIENTKTYLLDNELNPVPIGVVEELFIGGERLARGYLNRPDITAEKFIPNSYSGKPGDRLYRSGDLARYLPNGRLEFIGRVDNQVKIRGFRIELGEIENVLSNSPNIHEVIVLAPIREGESRENYLVAYVVLKTREKQDTDFLKQMMGKVLPEYMVPQHFVLLDELPLTPNGKIDRQALPEPESASLFKQEYIAPTTDTEKKLAHIWSKVLSLPESKVGILDNFFSLGGHSMLAAQVASQIRKNIGYPINIRDLFSANTIQKISLLIDDSKTEIHISSDHIHIPLVKVNRTSPIPIKRNHQRVLQFRKNIKNEMPRSTSNILVAFRISGKLDVIALLRSFYTLIKRHEILRTTFSSFESDANQIISNEIIFNLPVIDIHEIEISFHTDELANHVFDILNGPLFKACLLRLSPDSHALILNTDHIISDGWSQAAMHRDLSKLYENYSQNITPKLPPLPIQFADYVYWMEKKRKSMDFNRQIQFWEETLKDAPLLVNLPFDKIPPEKPTFRGGRIFLEISSETTRQLQNLSLSQEASLFMTMYAVYNVLIYRFTGQTDICSITLRAGRDLPELHDLIGPLFDNQILRVRVHKDMNFKELLRQVKNLALSAHNCPDASIADVLETLQYNSTSGVVKFIDFNYLGLDHFNLPLGDLNVSLIENNRKCYGGTLSVGVVKEEDHLKLYLTYSKDLFKHNTIQKLGRIYIALLEDMANKPEQSIG